MKIKIGKLCKFVAMIVCLLFATNFFSACSSKKDTSAYAITGYVYDELGKAIEGVTLSSDFTSTTTDKDGKFSISGLEGAFVLTASKDGYFFETSNKYITCATDNANFVAYGEYTVSGTAHNNQVAVPNASVVVSSLAGEFFTTTDEMGNFSISGVAGETNVSCEIDNLQFYETTATRENPTVQINTTSSLTLNFVEEFSNEIDYSKIELFVNGNKINIFSDTKVLKNISCGTVVELKSDYYNFTGAKNFVVDSLNQTEDFNISKFYSISGYVTSGAYPLSGANVFVDGKLSAVSGNDGRYELSNLWSNRNVSVEYSGLDFENKSLTPSSTSANFNGTKDVAVRVAYDKKTSADFEFNHSNSKKVSDYTYNIFDVCLGDEIAVSSDLYHLKNSRIVIDFQNEYMLEAQALYSVLLTGIEGLDVTIKLDGNAASLDEISSLYGTHTISASYSNYIFSSAVVDAKNTNVNLIYKIPYNVELSVCSGTLVLQGASVRLENGSNFISNEQGKVLLENLTDGNAVTISANGYNAKTILINGETQVDVSLDYNISGTVKTGNVAVAQAVVSAGEKTAETNSKGQYELFGLEGELEVLATKQGFEFSELLADKNTTLNFDGTYRISGNLISEELDVSTFVVKIRSLSTGEISSTLVVDETYSFDNLTGKYFLYVETSDGRLASLMPNGYNVFDSGVFNFSTSGFRISGYVKTGDVCIEGAKVTAGALSTYTDSNGYYCFELLTDTCDIYVQKAGYVFGNAITVSEDNDAVNFSATYSVSGKIAIDGIAIAGVQVFVGESQTSVAETNENGEYQISGISGTKILTFKKEGYSFAETVTVSNASDLVAPNSNSIKLKVDVSILCGNISLVGFDYFVNGTKIGTAQTSVIEILAKPNDVLTFEKTGYQISIVTITEPKSYAASATYSISGVAISGSEKIEDFEVLVNETKASATITENTFTISGLSGNAEIMIKKTGFTFGVETVSEPTTSLLFNGTYRVSGTVFVGSKVLAGTKVTISHAQSGAETFVTTGADGKFAFDWVSGKFDIVCEKHGYTFDEITNKFGEQRLTIDAYYSISGVVKSGDLVISGASVSLSHSGENKNVVTDLQGRFTIFGVKGVSSIIVEKDNYTPATMEGFNDLTENIVLNMKYSISINFDVAGVKVTLNGASTTLSGKVFTKSGLEGTNVASFELANTTFKPKSVITITGPGTFSFTSEKAYKASGYVKTESGIAVSGVKISSQGGDSKVTDKNGYYSFDAVAGEIYIDDKNITRDSRNIQQDGSSYNFSVSNKDFAVMLVSKGYDKLADASSVQVSATGTVVGVAAGVTTTQYVYALYKRDNNGNIVRQNLNNGKKVNIVVKEIDPRVSLVAIKNASGWIYQELRGDDVTSNTTANHTTSGLASTTLESINSTYGNTGYTPYEINSTSVTGISNLTANKDGSFSFDLSMSTSYGVSSYKTQIAKLAPAGTTFNGFTKITLSVIINKDGWISSIYGYDEYSINQITNANVTSKTTYTFHTNKPNLKIADISTASDEALNASLQVVSQTELATAANYSFKRYDVVSSTIYTQI